MKLKEWYRVNFEQRDDGIYYCDGNHEKNEGCTSHEVKLTIDDIKDIIKQGQAFDLSVVSLDEQSEVTVCEVEGCENDIFCDLIVCKEHISKYE